MGVLGTGIAAGVAQTGQQAQQVAKKKDKKARDRQAAADAVELSSLGQERVEADEETVPAGGAEPIGVATDNEQGDKPTDVGIQEALTQQHRPSAAADAEQAEVEPVSPAEAAASYQRVEDEAEQAHAAQAEAEAESVEAGPESPAAESVAAEPVKDPPSSQAASPHKHLDLQA